MRYKFVFVLLCIPLFLLKCDNFETLPSSRCLKIAVHDDPTSLRPDQAVSALDVSISKLLFEGLLRENSRSNNGVELALAENYTISPDQLTYTFFLKPSAKWSNGEPISSKDLLLAWEYAKNNTTYKHLFDEISFFAPSKSKLVISLTQQDPLLLKKLTSPIFSLFRPNDLNIFSGPFQLVNYTPGNQLLLQRNLYYYDAGQVYFDHIQLSVIPNIYTAIQLVQKGKYHLTGQPWHQGIPLEFNIKETNYYSFPIHGHFALLFNHNSPVFSSKNHCVAFVQKLNLASTIVPLVLRNQKALLNHNADIEDNSIEISDTSIILAYPSNLLRCQRIAESIREDCKHQGIHIQLDGSEYHIFCNKRSNYLFDIATITHVAYFPDEPIELNRSFKNCISIPLYQIQYDFITKKPLQEIIYNASGAVDLKYIRE